MKTVDALIKDATVRLLSVSDTAALDAALLLSRVTGLSRIELFTRDQDELSDEICAQFEALLGRRAQGEPMAYILGHKEFWGLDFEVEEGVLIPRPDTETLMAVLCAMIPKAAAARVADIGVGSGAIVVSLLHEFPQFEAEGVDISPTALRVCAANAARHGVEQRLTLHEGSYLTPLEGTFNLIVSNPPYIAKADVPELMKDVRAFEPHEALVGGEDGLDAYRALEAQAWDKLADGGLIAMEVGYDQAADVCKLFTSARWREIQTFKDLAGRDRVVAAVKA